MAERPVFLPALDAPGFVKPISFQIEWASGFAPIQKQKNVRALHRAAAAAGITPLLEISSKSDEKVGRHLSAFNLKIASSAGEIPLECAFQGSKVFERGGPYTDLFLVEPKLAKRDPRLRESGRLVEFNFDGHVFPTIPVTAFYDWLYLSALLPYKEWLKARLINGQSYKGFTDIEFNPSKSINCQAKSCALFVSLTQLDTIDCALSSPRTFIETLSNDRGHLTPLEALAV